ncbi:TPA: hypothetical protein JRW62_002132 [Elizabethkingia meningoseptica]|uniref:hypothetical protein n=1 Tax=Elizabethkingia meningoseptica TaxID=238 RepID=UPI0022F173A9|nr:hypothetical protein [Elizabethkingia meningoseptica]EJK5327964.1 hypothetical protein [Elizabethkingia meningoseptica]WBS74274.1 hypothetical protein PF438_15405 [Elizabethkingia meningoseptica]HAY3563130.1 hypothetical protein [Elizabethkingia meningoseptica]
MKDIFIDNNVAKNFATPVDPHYKNLIEWINEFDKELVEKHPDKKREFAHLVVSQKLLAEYLSSSRDCSKPSAIPAIVNRLTIEGRILKKTKKEIEDFQSKYFTKTISKSLHSNTEDHVHIVCVLLSNRKLCLTYDENLTKDLSNFPKHTVIISERPEKLNYK